MTQSFAQVSAAQGQGGDNRIHQRSNAGPGSKGCFSQRTSLHDLATLAARCADAERRIEQEYHDSIESVETEYRQSVEALDQRLAQARQSIEETYAARVRESESALQTQQQTLKAKEAKIRNQWKAKHDSVERTVRHQYEQEKWLADSELEANQTRARAEAAAIRKTLDGHAKALNELASDAADLMRKYGFAPPQPSQVSEPAAFESQSHASERFEKNRQQAQERLNRLKHLIVPRLFVGVTPYLLIVLLCLLAAVAGQWWWGAVSWDQLGTARLDWSIMAYTAAGTFVAVLIIGVGLRFYSRSRLRERYAAFDETLHQARQAATRWRQMVDEAEQQQKAQAEQAHAHEISRLRGKYFPTLDQARQKRDAALSQAAQAYKHALAKIQAEYDQNVAMSDEERRRKVQEVDQQHEAERGALEQKCSQQREEIDRDHHDKRLALEKRLSDGLVQTQSPAADPSGETSLVGELSWDDPAWRQWKPPAAFNACFRFGSLKVDLRKIAQDAAAAGAEASAEKGNGRPVHGEEHTPQLALPPAFDVPALLTIPEQGSLLIRHDPSGRLQALQTLQVTMVRLLTGLPPGRVRFTLIDPVGLGQNFAGFMHLADYDDSLVGGRIWTESAQIDQRLSDLTEHMETVIQKYLRNEYETIDDYNRQAGELAEPYRFLVIADFPTGFSEEALRRLASISASGARCGVYTLIASDRRHALAQSLLDDLAARSVYLSEQSAQVYKAAHRESVSDEIDPHLRDGHADPRPPQRPELPADPSRRFTWEDEVYGQFPLTLDSSPDEGVLTSLMERVGQAAKQAKRVEVPFASIAPGVDEIWSRNSRDDLRVPIGQSGATRHQFLRLGHGVAQHGLIAGKTGSGKSTLLHVLISNIALWYPPDEAELYLIDFKRGVEFKTYATHTLPHVRAVAVESDREFGLSVLQRLDAELARRGELFRKTGVQDLSSYRQNTAGPLPRILLVIDEFQEFFTEEDRLAQEAALLLDRLVRQGRAFGIHLMLGSQTISGASGLARSTLGQMGVRIALQTSETDSQLILGDDNTAARLLDRPGEAIYNDAGGLVEANSPFQVAWMDDAEREAQLARVDEMVKGRGIAASSPIVFEGGAPADLAHNRALSDWLRQEPTAQPGAPLAQLGDPVAIKAPTSIAMRAVSGKNLLIVGQQPEAAMATLMAAGISLSAQHGASDAQFVVLNATPVDSPLAGRLEKLGDVLRQEVKLVPWRDTGQAIGELATTLQSRQEDPDRRHPAIYVLLYGLQRYRMLRKSEESFSFSAEPEDKAPDPSDQFMDLLREGPGVGIHVLAWCDTPASLERTLDRAALREFDHRVLFQISANDSSNLIDSPAANNLGFHRALAYSEEQGTLEKFRPYALPDAHWMEKVKTQLAGRRNN